MLRWNTAAGQKVARKSNNRIEFGNKKMLYFTKKGKGIRTSHTRV